jgi:hypothetical protein
MLKSTYPDGPKNAALLETEEQGESNHSLPFTKLFCDVNNQSLFLQSIYDASFQLINSFDLQLDLFVVVPPTVAYP